MRPFWSPTTTSAAKPKFLPPFTTLATRLIATSLSMISDCSRSSPPSGRRPRPRSPRSPPRSLRSPRSPASRAIRVSSEFQTALAGGIGERFHAAVEKVAAAVEHHVGDAGLLGALSDELANSGGVFGFLAALEVLLERGGGGDGNALRVVDDLHRDVLGRTVDGQTRLAIGDEAELGADALGAASLFFAMRLHGYFFLPSLRRTYSPTLRTPLPL